LRSEVRGSCGCATDALGSGTGGRDLSLDVSPAQLRDELQDELGKALLTGHAVVDDPLRDAVLAMVGETERLLHSGEDVTAAEIQSLTTSLHRHPAPRRPAPHHGRVTEYVKRSATTAAGDRGGTTVTGPERLTAALWQLQAGAFLQQSEATETALEEQYVVDAGLLDAARSDPRHLDWLAGTHVSAGALALWEDDPSSCRLRIVGIYDPEGLLPHLLGTATTAEHFPPTPLIAVAQPTDRGVCVIVPVRTLERDWGLLAVVGEIDMATARETYQHWAALLCASLESQRLQETVRKSALYDALTRLPNRQLFLERLEHALALWQRSGTPFAVLFLDLDGFKLINDSLGHQMGDRMLTAVGARIVRELRAVDTGARFGGDEFVILLHDTDPGDALVVAQRVQVALAEVSELDGYEIAIRASLGIATSAIEYTSAEDILRDADTAMYRAKSAQPGTAAFFDAAMHASAQYQQSLHSEIHRGLQENQFAISRSSTWPPVAPTASRR
jgi:diguanylate cyclase (GGDEF)-like protein